MCQPFCAAPVPVLEWNRKVWFVSRGLFCPRHPGGRPDIRDSCRGRGQWAVQYVEHRETRFIGLSEGVGSGSMGRDDANEGGGRYLRHREEDRESVPEDKQNVVSTLNPRPPRRV